MRIIRRDTDYAIRALAHLAGTDPEVVPCRQLAEACKIPKSFAYKILRKLTERGLVTSFVGNPGGFRLRKDPAKITLYEIVDAAQGAVSVAKCIMAHCEYGHKNNCPVSREWRKLQNNIIDFLKQTTLKSILSSAG